MHVLDHSKDTSIPAATEQLARAAIDLYIRTGYQPRVSTEERPATMRRVVAKRMKSGKWVPPSLLLTKAQRVERSRKIWTARRANAIRNESEQESMRDG